MPVKRKGEVFHLMLNVGRIVYAESIMAASAKAAEMLLCDRIEVLQLTPHVWAVFDRPCTDKSAEPVGSIVVVPVYGVV